MDREPGRTGLDILWAAAAAMAMMSSVVGVVGHGHGSSSSIMED